MQAFCKVFSFLYYCFNISKVTLRRSRGMVSASPLPHPKRRGVIETNYILSPEGGIKIE